MRIFDLPELQKNDLFAGNLSNYWLSFSSFNVNAAELSHQDQDISRTKGDFQEHDTFHLMKETREHYEQAERMV
ncbi:hypothetical protein [Treponema sp.]|uniref:hypothetical protein n=1 Tax=Treponema sp. TaxID=166 RepID=UPI0038904ADA